MNQQEPEHPARIDLAALFFNNSGSLLILFPFIPKKKSSIERKCFLSLTTSEEQKQSLCLYPLDRKRIDHVLSRSNPVPGSIYRTSSSKGWWWWCRPPVVFLSCVIYATYYYSDDLLLFTSICINSLSDNGTKEMYNQTQYRRIYSRVPWLQENSIFYSETRTIWLVIEKYNSRTQYQT